MLTVQGQPWPREMLQAMVGGMAIWKAQPGPGVSLPLALPLHPSEPVGACKMQVIILLGAAVLGKMPISLWHVVGNGLAPSGPEQL